jgi:dATP pyrophosphohydrolase
VGDYRRPESVLVVIYTEQADVLLLERVQPFAFWQSVTGTLGAGEAPSATARREVFEETGLADAGRMIETGVRRVFEIDPRWRHRYAPGVIHNTEYEFRYRLAEALPVSVDAREHSAYQWLGIDQAIETVWSWTNREALERLRDEL